MYGPVLEGKLIRLRPPMPEDAPVMIGWFQDLEVTRYVQLRTPPSVEGEREWFDRMSKDPDSVLWTVEFEQRAVGSTMIRSIDWRNGFGTTGTIIGDKTLWGKGLGRELMQLRAAYAFTQLPLRKLKSSYTDGNDASGRAQAAAGYREVGRYRRDCWVDGEWRDHILTEVLREDWEAARSKHA